MTKSDREAAVMLWNYHDDDLPAATFDDDDLSVGQVAVAAALVPGSKDGSRPASTVYAGTVLTTGQALDADTVTSDFSATAIEAPLSGDDLGCPLIDSSGQVSGMLEMTKGSGASTMAVFLPAELVIGVVRQIVSTGSVDQGWLGIQTSNASSPTSMSSTATVVTSASSTRWPSCGPGSTPTRREPTWPSPSTGPAVPRPPRSSWPIRTATNREATLRRSMSPWPCPIPVTGSTPSSPSSAT